MPEVALCVQVNEFAVCLHTHRHTLRHTYLLVGEERGELGGRRDGSLLLLLLDVGGQSGGARADDRLADVALLVVLLREGVGAIAATALPNDLSHGEFGVVGSDGDHEVYFSSTGG